MSKLRDEGGRAFDRALGLCESGPRRLRGLRLREELRDALGYEEPPAASTIREWRLGLKPVRIEVVLAACQLAGAKLTIAPNGKLTVSLEESPSLRSSGRLAAGFGVIAGALSIGAWLLGMTGAFVVAAPVVSKAETLAASVAQSLPVPAPAPTRVAYASAPGRPRPSTSPAPASPRGGSTSTAVLAASEAVSATPAPSAAPVVASPTPAAPARPAPSQAPVTVKGPPVAPPVVTSVDPPPAPPPTPTPVVEVSPLPSPAVP